MKLILGKLHKIMEEVDYIQKDGKNSFQKYSYATEKAIKEKFHTALVAHKVLFQLSTTNARVDNNVTFLDCNYTFHDVESGEFISGTFVGTGSARDEKGNYAAVTGAIKYILTSNLLVPTGDDPEDDVNEPPKKTPVVKVQKSEVTPPKPYTFRVTADKVKEIYEIVKNKNLADTKEQVVPMINEALGMDIGSLEGLDRTTANEIIEGLKGI